MNNKYYDYKLTYFKYLSNTLFPPTNPYIPSPHSLEFRDINHIKKPENNNNVSLGYIMIYEPKSYDSFSLYIDLDTLHCDKVAVRNKVNKQ